LAGLEIPPARVDARQFQMKNQSTKKNDLAVCYRIYPCVSRKPVFGFKDKLALVRLNLESFCESLGELNIKLWVLLDNCPPQYAELLESVFSEIAVDLIPLKGEGNGRTFARQIDILTRQAESDLVYFAEDDYLYLPRAMEYAVRFMRRHPQADFLTLYDHADHYSKYIHRLHGEEFVEDDHRWRMLTSTCLTFMARREAVIESAKVFTTFPKNSDLGLWMALTKRRVANPWSWLRSLGDGLFCSISHALAWRYAWRQILFGKRRTLWVPAPSLATHMEIGGLAPGVDWEKRFGARARALQENGTG
jgi:hypothetical protein